RSRRSPLGSCPAWFSFDLRVLKTACGKRLRLQIRRTCDARSGMNRTEQPRARSVSIDSELGEIFQRAGVERNGRLADALVLFLELVRLAVHRNPVGLLVEHRLHDVVG